MSAAPRTNSAPVYASIAKAVPFSSADEAWIWTMSALMARREGARIVAGAGTKLRPCDPDDVVKCLDRLYRHRRIDLVHARIMRIWGERGTAPDPRHLNEKADWHIWSEAMRRLDWPLRMKGIVAGEPRQDGMADVVELASRWPARAAASGNAT
jgi:hypothetical protein